jgi:hypothetical protein
MGISYLSLMFGCPASRPDHSYGTSKYDEGDRGVGKWSPTIIYSSNTAHDHEEGNSIFSTGKMIEVRIRMGCK